MGEPRIDLTGHAYGQLEVLERMPAGGRQARWQCRCDCGAETIVYASNLRSGHTRSCGCLHGERHGQTETREWVVWSKMRNRCGNANDKDYVNYGGRGIRVCKRWQSFNVFFEDMGECPEDHSIERIDNYEGYEPGNCRWATKKEQANNRRSSRWVEFNGDRKTLMQWAECVGIHCSTIARRLDYLGWSIEEALTTPLRGRRG